MPQVNPQSETSKLHVPKDVMFRLTCLVRGLTVVTNASFSKCINCDKDELCGGLWKAIKFPIPAIESGTRLIINYIISALDQNLVKGDDDHDHDDNKDPIVVFLKDDTSPRNLYQCDAYWSDFDNMVRLESSSNGCACGAAISGINNAHSVTITFGILFNKFNLQTYDHDVNGYGQDGDEFKSKYANLGSFSQCLSMLGQYQSWHKSATVVLLLYLFLTSRQSVWNVANKMLARGNNIQEGHYME